MEADTEMRKAKLFLNHGFSPLMRFTRLAGVGLCLIVGAQPANSQQKQPADPKADATVACRDEVRSRVHQSHPQEKNFQIHRGRMEQWQQSKNEIGFSGEGRVQVRSGEWKEFSFTCTYNTRHSQITAADVRMESDGTSGSGSGSGGSYSPEENTGGMGSGLGSQATSGTSVPDHGVTLYRDLNFLGLGETFDGDVADLRGSRVGDDQATSIRVHGGCRARLHRDPNFRGGYLEVNADIADLRSTQIGDDSASSIEVRCNGRSDWSDQGGGATGGSWNEGSGDSWSSGSSSAPYGLTLYRDPDYAGVSETFTRDVEDLWDSRIGNDQATSVRVSRGCRARLYRDGNYRGNYVEVDADIPDLRNSPVGDDSISSIRVRCEQTSWGDEWSGGAGSNPYGVTLHRDPQFKGTSETFEEDVRDLRYSRIGNDQATSVSISRGCRARLYRDPDFSGSYTEIDRDVADLRGSQVGDDAISSLEIRCDR
jgi:hypothetical protein